MVVDRLYEFWSSFGFVMRSFICNWIFCTRHDARIDDNDGHSMVRMTRHATTGRKKNDKPL